MKYEDLIKELKKEEKVLRMLSRHGKGTRIPIKNNKIEGVDIEEIKDIWKKYNLEFSISKGMLFLQMSLTDLVSCLREQIIKLEDQKIKLEDQKLQKTVKNTQIIIAFVMVLTVIISLGSVFFTYKSYELAQEPFKPKITLSRYCSPVSINDTIIIQTHIGNSGYDAVYITGMYETENIKMGNFEWEGIIFEEGPQGNQRLIPRRHLLGHDSQDHHIPVYVGNLTVYNFSISFKFDCESTTDNECQLINQNFYTCRYHKDGNIYKLYSEDAPIGQHPPF